MSLYLAIDAGGTKTDYLLADDHRQLARVRTGTIKRMRTDSETAAANLRQALSELTAQSGLGMESVTRTCIGTAGESVPLVADWLRDSLGQHVAGDLLLLGDVEIALDAAFPGQPGVLVLAGTGSNVAGRDTHGRLSTAGGWGPVLADQGSGHRVGLEALRALFLALDEGRDTLLLAAVLDFWQLGSKDDLVEFANRIPHPDFSRLTALVVRCAQQGDATAQAVLEREGQELAYLVRLVLRRQQRAAQQRPWSPRIAFAGSIMEKIPAVRDALIAAVANEFPTVETRTGVVDPIEGALWRARTANQTTSTTPEHSVSDL